MNKKKCVEFLMKLFWQSYSDENFYRTMKKIGIDFQSWPRENIFQVCKHFDLLVSKKSFNAAVFETQLEIPKNIFNQFLEIDEVKIYYAKYKSFLKSIELSEDIKKDPENAASLCNNFLLQKTTSAKIVSLFEAVDSFVNENEKRIKNKIENVSIVGFELLSQIISGFNSGRVTIITAHSGFGKSNLAINFFKNCIASNLNSIFFNMEMDLIDLTKRFLQAQYKMTQSDFLKEGYIQKLSNGDRPWMDSGGVNFFSDGSSLSISEIGFVVAEKKRSQKLDIIFVDYDQKIVEESGDSEDEWRFIQRAVEKLEAIAKREAIHIVLFSQTDEDKAGAPRASKRAIQPASAVIYFHKNNEGQIVFKFVKNRFGPTDKQIVLNYNPENSLICEDKIKDEFLQQPKPSGFMATPNRGHLNAYR